MAIYSEFFLYWPFLSSLPVSPLLSPSVPAIATVGKANSTSNLKAPTNRFRRFKVQNFFQDSRYQKELADSVDSLNRRIGLRFMWMYISILSLSFICFRSARSPRTPCPVIILRHPSPICLLLHHPWRPKRPLVSRRNRLLLPIWLPPLQLVNHQRQQQRRRRNHRHRRHHHHHHHHLHLRSNQLPVLSFPTTALLPILQPVRRSRSFCPPPLPESLLRQQTALVATLWIKPKVALPLRFLLRLLTSRLSPVQVRIADNFTFTTRDCSFV